MHEHHACGRGCRRTQRMLDGQLLCSQRQLFDVAIEPTWVKPTAAERVHAGIRQLKRVASTEGRKIRA
jgi:hypothetical protein